MVLEKSDLGVPGLAELVKHSAFDFDSDYDLLVLSPFLSLSVCLSSPQKNKINKINI